MEILRLKEVLKERGMSGKDLAEAVEVTPASISNIVNGNSFPKPELLKAIADSLGVDIRSLFHPTKEIEYDQIKHEQLVQIINALEGKEVFAIKKETVSIANITDINEINKGVVLMLNAWHVRAGSSGDYNLYRLLQKYLTDEKIRKQINNLI